MGFKSSKVNFSYPEKFKPHKKGLVKVFHIETLGTHPMSIR
ncbi:MAG: hypothetical protein ACTSPY_12120 [Candidatus Helarchaeota archaeon]